MSWRRHHFSNPTFVSHCTKSCVQGPWSLVPKNRIFVLGLFADPSLKLQSNYYIICQTMGSESLLKRKQVLVLNCDWWTAAPFSDFSGRLILSWPSWKNKTPGVKLIIYTTKIDKHLHYCHNNLVLQRWLIFSMLFIYTGRECKVPCNMFNITQSLKTHCFILLNQSSYDSPLFHSNFHFRITHKHY